MLKSHKPLVVLVGAALAAGALYTGVASASSSRSPSSVRAEVSNVDTDNIQQGDQSSPDGATEGAVTAKEQTSSTDTDNIQQGDQSSPDGASSASETTSASETQTSEAGPSDGPGGHADPEGNVDHQFEGNE